MNTEHTPIPYRIVIGRVLPIGAACPDELECVAYIVGDNDSTVATARSVRFKDDAAFIVRACNSHAALVAALEAEEVARKLDADSQELAERAYAEGWDNDPTGSSHVTSANRRAYEARKQADELRRAALKAAKGEA